MIYIKEMLVNIPHVRIQHIPETGNNVAHRLAAIAYEDKTSCFWFHSVSECICDG